MCAGTLALPEEGIGSLVARVTGSFELSDVGAIYIKVLRTFFFHSMASLYGSLTTVLES